MQPSRPSKKKPAGSARPGAAKRGGAPKSGAAKAGGPSKPGGASRAGAPAKRGAGSAAPGRGSAPAKRTAAAKHAGGPKQSGSYVRPPRRADGLDRPPVPEVVEKRAPAGPAKPAAVAPKVPGAPGIAGAPARRVQGGRRVSTKPGMIRVKCKEAETLMDLSGGMGKRFYQLDTLEHAIEGPLNQGNSWLLGAIRETLMGGNPTSVKVELLWENTYSLSFRVTAVSAQGKPGRLLLVVAKNHQEHSERLRGEIDTLRTLAPHCPGGILPVRMEGTFFLPNKYVSQGKGRQVLAYVRAWPGDCLATTFVAQGQYVLLERDRRLLSRAESDSYGASLAMLLVKAFDPLTRNGPSLPSLHWGDVLCRTFRRGVVPTLIHCTKVTRYRSIQAYLKGLLLWEPEKDSNIFPMQWIAPDVMVQLLRECWGEDLGAEAVRRLSAAGGDVSLPETYLEGLRSALMEQVK